MEEFDICRNEIIILFTGAVLANTGKTVPTIIRKVGGYIKLLLFGLESNTFPEFY